MWKVHQLRKDPPWDAAAPWARIQPRYNDTSPLGLSTLAAPHAVTFGRLFVRPLLAIESSTDQKKIYLV